MNLKNYDIQSQTNTHIDVGVLEVVEVIVVATMMIMTIIKIMFIPLTLLHTEH
jgi:hypothetical protein